MRLKAYKEYLKELIQSPAFPKTHLSTKHLDELAKLLAKEGLIIEKIISSISGGRIPKVIVMGKVIDDEDGEFTFKATWKEDKGKFVLEDVEVDDESKSN